jgi:hypothetical protein
MNMDLKNFEDKFLNNFVFFEKKDDFPVIFIPSKN